MKKHLLLLLLISFPAIAQIEFVPGYFIDNNGNRTPCLIRDEGWKNNPAEFQYKTDDTQKSLTASIANVSEFGTTEGIKFIRFKVDMDMSSNNINDFSHVKQPEFVEQTIFLKTLVDGDISLLSYESDNQIRFFIYKKDNQTAEQLICKNYLVDSSTFLENNYFRQQLYNALKSEQLTQKNFEHLEYKQDKLIAIFEKYYNNNGRSYVSREKELSGTKLHFAITAGANFSGVRLLGGGNDVDISTGAHASPGFGVELESILPYNHGKWGLFINPNYHHFKYDEIFFGKSLVVDYKAINIPFGVRHYMFLGKESKLFIDGGYNLGVSFSSKLQYGSTKFETSNGSNSFFGLGYNYKKYTAEIRYSLMQSLIRYSNWEAGYGSIQLMFAYKIF